MSELPNIALIGKAGSGKTTAANLLTYQYDYHRLTFAGKHEGGLRDVAMRIWGPKAENDRPKLIALGNAVRDIDEDAWVNAALRDVPEKQVFRHDGRGAVDNADQLITHERLPLVCDDCRFPNEARRLKVDEFIIIRIVAGRNVRIARLEASHKLGDPGWEENISETALDTWPEDYKIINENLTKPELFEELTKCIKLDRQYA